MKHLSHILFRMFLFLCLCVYRVNGQASTVITPDCGTVFVTLTAAGNSTMMAVKHN
jgi:hypothetical protein